MNSGNNESKKFDVEEIRKQFPILETTVEGKPLIYFDNAATTQKPRRVIEAIRKYYEAENANVHRGIHYLSELATEKYEQARGTVAKFLNAKETSEIVFTRGTTEGINLVSSSLARSGFFKEGDEVIISEMEHHSNIVPWQLIAGQTGIKLKVIPFTDNGELEMGEYENLFTSKTKFVSLVHVSNTLGTVNPVKEAVKIAHEHGVQILIDGAQATAHIEVDVQDLDCDFYVFSGHKTFGATGIGTLYGKKELLEKLPPYQGGGEMIREVTFEKSTFEEPPLKFEAGTPNIAGGIVLGEALEFLNSIDRKAAEAHEQKLLSFATEKLLEIDGLKIIGTAPGKSAVVSFVIEGVHHYDIGTMINNYGVALRTGHHCTQPIMKHYGITGTARASFALYNTIEEVESFVNSLNRVIKILR